MSERQQAVNAIARLLKMLEPKRMKFRGLLGYPGTTTVKVANRDNYVYVREYGNDSRVYEVYNNTVPPVYNYPVTIGTTPENPEVLQVLGIDLTAFWTWGDLRTSETHHKTHEYGAIDENGTRIDSDVVFIQSKQFVPLSVRPRTTAGMTVYIEAGWYGYGETTMYWPGGVSKTFSAPATSGNAVFELIYVDATTGYLGYVRGSEFPSIYLTDYEDMIPNPPVGAGAIAAIYMTSATTSLTFDNFVDVRKWIDIPGGPLHLSEGLTITGDVLITGGRLDMYDSYTDLGASTLSRARLPRGTLITGWSGSEGEIAWDTSFDKLYVHDGSAYEPIPPDFQQTVTVAKSGGDYTTIQGAIDSIIGASATNRYCVLIYPGDYAETVVGKSYVELMGLAAREAVNITGATGPLYTFPDNEGHIFNLKFSLSPTTANQVIISVPATVAARQIINNCLFVSTSSSDVATSIFDVDGGEIEFRNNKVIMTNTNTTGGAIRTQRVFDIDGDAIVDVQGNIVDVAIYDVNDRIIFFDDASTTGGDIHIVQNIIHLISHNAGAYSGIIRALNFVSTVGHIHSHSNTIKATSFETGGTGRGEYVRVNSAAGGGIIDSTSNHILVEDFATNYWANVAAGDEIISHFDDIVAVDDVIGAGTFTYVNSVVDGSLSVSDDINIAEAGNIVVGTVTGTEIATAAAQKLGFFGVTPVVQQAAIADSDGTLADVNTKFKALLAELRALGLIAT